MSVELKNKQESGGLKALKDALNTTAVILRLAMFILFLAFLFSGMKNLEQYEEAVVLRFGAETGAVRKKAGMQFALPYPVDQMIVVPVGRTQSISSNSFMFKEIQVREVAPYLKPGVDGYLITADGNILHCASTLKYQVENINGYLFSLKKEQRDAIIRNLLDNSILKSAAQLTLEQALDKKQLIAESKLILQRQLDDLEAGVRVDLLDIRVSVPRQVEENRREVVKARNQADTLIAEAEKYARQRADETENDLVKTKYAAEIWKTRMMGRAEADLKTFKKLLSEYKKNPEQVKAMLLRNAMSDVSGKLEEVFVFDGSDERELRIQMSRQPINDKTKADEAK